MLKWFLARKSKHGETYKGRVFPPRFHPSPFSASGHGGKLMDFVCSEQYFMYHKALFANDIDAAEKILSLGHLNSMEMKMIGRGLKMSNSQINKWNEASSDIMREAVYRKFEQNAELRKFLFFSHGTRNVEASPTDRIWGIGMPIEHKDAANPLKWMGANRLGAILDDVREQLWNDSRFEKERHEVQSEIIRKQKNFLESFQ
ncbi:unnamed protein product [Caenorhabditis auriculariae]|uniref:NADAR domain-containing protein n=1 Tax=Caenorhabditis auriculariae TaxID=2777116 RepID=A0A8S1GNP2_9PELO|nr:unnamed protein product [Caenorhabditis auriculariae]